ncbi:MAG: NAD(P)/FAD-dependent oxidoreductase [Candidatus Riflebacteria bacterium]|nr:NAD(P)/FAD-dependent oxidoreductase [Candidatus Riflebacteria bacterium]
MSQDQTILILGNGIAGTTAAFTLRDNGFPGKIILVSEEPYPVYFRTRLPELLSGETTVEKIITTDPAKHTAKNIELLLNRKAINLEANNKTVTFSDGKKIQFDKLILATGCQANIPPIKGLSEATNAFSLRNASDAEKIFNAAKGKKEVICIGGGVLGLEAAYHLTKLGLRAQVLEYFPRLMPRQLDEKGSITLQKCLEKKGFSFSLGVKITEISQTGEISNFHTTNSQTFSGDLILLSTGISPRKELIGSTEIKCERGIVIDENCETTAKGIFAAGDNVQFQGKTWGTWIVARHWGARVGNILAGKLSPLKMPNETYRLKITGVDLLSIGETDLENQLSGNNDFLSNIIEDSPEQGKYAKIITEKGLIKGAIILGAFSFTRNVEKAVQDNLPFEKFLETIKK